MFFFTTACRPFRDTSGSGSGDLEAMQLMCITEQFINRTTDIENICGSIDLSTVSHVMPICHMIMCIPIHLGGGVRAHLNLFIDGFQTDTIICDHVLFSSQGTCVNLVITVAIVSSPALGDSQLGYWQLGVLESDDIA